MKKIILYTNNIHDRNNQTNVLDNPYYIVISADNASRKDFETADFFLIDADSKPNISEIIKTHKNNSKLFWAYTSNTSKNNVLKLYNLGFDNVIERPDNLSKTCEIMVNPENQIIDSEKAEQLKLSKRVLLMAENGSEPDDLIEILSNLNCIFTYRSASVDSLKEFQKDNYDLIVLNDLKIGKYQKILTEINNSKLNKNTPTLIITQNTNLSKLTGKISTLSFLAPGFKKEFAQVQISNLLQIKELQEKSIKEKELLEDVMMHSNKQMMLTSPDFIILSSGNNYFTTAKGDYLFGLLNKYSVNYPKEEILTFINSNKKNILFNFTYNENNYEFQASKIYTKNGALQGYLVIIDDITQKSLLEEQKETFIATLTHDLKSPIRAEQSVLKQLIEGKFGKMNSAQIEIMSEMLNSREYMKRMIDNILTRYKCSSGKLELSVTQNNFKSTLEEAINDVLYMINEKQQSLSVTYKAETTEFLYDNIEIKRVLTNLIANAAEYTPPKGSIKINISEKNNDFIIKIADNGYGIAPDEIDNIFNKNVTNAKKYRKVGSGLGLYIAKTIINAHNGTISVKSELNKGSVFTVCLPIKNQIENTMPTEYYQNLVF